MVPGKNVAVEVAVILGIEVELGTVAVISVDAVVLIKIGVAERSRVGSVCQSRPAQAILAGIIPTITAKK